MALKLGWKADVLRGAQAGAPVAQAPPPPPPGPLPAAQAPPPTSQLSEGLIETFAALSVGTTPATVITSTSVAASTVTAGLRYFTTQLRPVARPSITKNRAVLEPPWSAWATAPNLLFSLAPVVVLLNDSYVMTTTSYCPRPCTPSFLAAVVFSRSKQEQFSRHHFLVLSLSLLVLSLATSYRTYFLGRSREAERKTPLGQSKGLGYSWSRNKRTLAPS